MGLGPHKSSLSLIALPYKVLIMARPQPVQLTLWYAQVTNSYTIRSYETLTYITPYHVNQFTKTWLVKYLAQNDLLSMQLTQLLALGSYPACQKQAGREKKKGGRE